MKNMTVEQLIMWGGVSVMLWVLIIVVIGIAFGVDVRVLFEL